MTLTIERSQCGLGVFGQMEDCIFDGTIWKDARAEVPSRGRGKDCGFR